MNTEHDVRIDVTKLHPQLQYKLKRMLAKCEKKGLYLIITQGYRSVAEQDALYARGRTAPGSVVTNARGISYSSQHQWGIAFDIAINDKHKTYDAALIKKAADIGKSVGLGWGGDWVSFKDTPHFYLKKWGSTTIDLKIEYGTVDEFKKKWIAHVDKDTLNLYKGIDKEKIILKLHKYEKVDVLYKRLWYAKVNYKGTIGYCRKKYLTSR